MSDYAKVVDGKVTQVIVAQADFFKTFIDTSPGTWLETSYDTRGGVNAKGKALRGNYAGIGHTYDAKNDVFYAPQPYPSWTIAAPTWIWTAPTPRPTTGKAYDWDETTKTWVEVPSII
jgi:hypothetical protein